MIINWARLQEKLLRKNTAIKLLLKRLSQLYGGAVRYRLLKSYRREGLRKKVPALVISVGNIVAGGAGKTPMVRWLARHFSAKGMKVSVVTRGYGRRRRNRNLVVLAGDSRNMSWKYVGDEPYMLFRQLNNVPVIVGKSRYRCAFEAIKRFGSEVIIMDDGFQHWALERDIDLVLLDCRKPFDNGYLIPLGRLREPVSHLVRADAIVLTRVPGEEIKRRTGRMLNSIFPGIPLFGSCHVPVAIRECATGIEHEPQFISGKRVLAFSGIATPEDFFETLKRSGAIVIETISFPDHYEYGEEDVIRIIDTAKRKKVDFVITTEKDEVKLTDYVQMFNGLYSLVIDIRFLNEKLFCDWLEKRANL